MPIQKNLGLAAVFGRFLFGGSVHQFRFLYAGRSGWRRMLASFLSLQNLRSSAAL
jgi:hypothetical protein